MTLPRLLVIDDLVGWSLQDRATMCSDLALLDVTEGNHVTGGGPYLAEAVFVPDVIRHGNEIVADDASVKSVLDLIATAWEGQPDARWALLLVDLQFDFGEVKSGPLDPDRNWPRHAEPVHGVRLLEAMKDRWPDPEQPQYTALPVVTLSRRPRGELEARLNGLGNRGYIERGQATALQQRLELTKLLFSEGLLPDGIIPALRSNGKPIGGLRERRIIGTSLALLRALRKARKAATSSTACLLMGEPGVGKELFSGYIHELSPRSSGPFVAVNCAAIPKDLIESELFGYDPGAFTGAKSKGKPGQFEIANGGSIFLDEVGDTSVDAQAKMLRVLQEGEIARLGGLATKKVDVRVIAATNKDLEEAVRLHAFRRDLLGRLGGIANGIRIPPLREREGDVPLLFRHFLDLENQHIQGRTKNVEPEVYDRLAERKWAENNVRELQSLVRTILIDRQNSEVVVGADIPRDTATSQLQPSPTPARPILHTTNGLCEALAALRAAESPRALRDLRGTLTSMKQGFAEVIRRVLHEALIETRDAKGELQPTTAIRELLGRGQMSSSDAASELLRLVNAFPGILLPNVAEDDAVAVAVHWAEGLRRKRDNRQRGNA